MHTPKAITLHCSVMQILLSQREPLLKILLLIETKLFGSLKKKKKKKNACSFQQCKIDTVCLSIVQLVVMTIMVLLVLFLVPLGRIILYFFCCFPFCCQKTYKQRHIELRLTIASRCVKHTWKPLEREIQYTYTYHIKYIHRSH